MTSAETAAISVQCERRTYPPYDAFHGTPSAMQWRRVTIQTPQGGAAFEQTDYGHAGRFNPWDPRGIAPALAPRLSQLRAVAEAIEQLL